MIIIILNVFLEIYHIILYLHFYIFVIYIFILIENKISYNIFI